MRDKLRALIEQLRLHGMAEVLDAVRTSSFAPEALNVVFADGVEGEVVGSASVVRLVQSAPAAPFGSVCEENPLHLHPDWDLGEIVRKSSGVWERTLGGTQRMSWFRRAHTETQR